MPVKTVSHVEEPQQRTWVVWKGRTNVHGSCGGATTDILGYGIGPPPTMWDDVVEPLHRDTGDNVDRTSSRQLRNFMRGTSSEQHRSVKPVATLYPGLETE